MCCVVLCCLVLCCFVLYCVVLFCVVFCCFVLFCFVLCCFVLSCVVLCSIVFHCVPLCSIVFHRVPSCSTVSHLLLLYTNTFALWHTSTDCTLSPLWHVRSNVGRGTTHEQSFSTNGQRTAGELELGGTGTGHSRRRTLAVSVFPSCSVFSIIVFHNCFHNCT